MTTARRSPVDWIVAIHALIIEDEGFIALWIEEVLLECGFDTVAIATSEASAVEEATSKCPDLITCDVRLSPGSGVEAIRSICSAKPIPVIFVTGSAEEVRPHYPNYSILTKPTTSTRLRNEVALAIAARR